MSLKGSVGFSRRYVGANRWVSHKPVNCLKVIEVMVFDIISNTQLSIINCGHVRSSELRNIDPLYQVTGLVSGTFLIER